MGTYLNPGNGGFERIVKSPYVDKTGIIGIINSRIDTINNLVCISRPRRFGKSYAAQTLCAYYDHSCDSHSLFDDKEISRTEQYEKYINKYNVLYLDIAGFVSDVMRHNGDVKKVVERIAQMVQSELAAELPELKSKSGLSECLIAYAEATKMKFVFIIDEWDALIREAKNDEATQKAYLNLLREWFKNGNFTSKVVAAAYMTGILPIKKDKSQSAISDFDEFTVLEPGVFSEYTGFTEDEVRKLCTIYNMNFDEAKQWYDGYTFYDVQSIYNPYSIIKAMTKRIYRSYWQHTSAAENLETLININKDGLQEDIVKLIAGEQIVVNIKFCKCCEMLDACQVFYTTRPCHNLGDACHFGICDDKLLKETLNGNEAVVAETIQHVREMNYAPMFYNNEQALRYVIKFAYIVCIDYYLKVEELPTGQGIADVVFVPKSDTALPAMIVELKWNKTADSAIAQIKEKNYPSLLSGYAGEMVLVGINYDVKTKEHSCKIENISI